MNKFENRLSRLYREAQNYLAYDEYMSSGLIYSSPGAVRKVKYSCTAIFLAHLHLTETVELKNKAITLLDEYIKPESLLKDEYPWTMDLLAPVLSSAELQEIRFMILELLACIAEDMDDPSLEL
jgi:hypothetical protein